MKNPAGIGIGHAFDLFFDRLDYARMPVAQTRHVGTAACIHIAFAVGVNEIRAFAADCDG